MLSPPPSSPGTRRSGARPRARTRAAGCRRRRAPAPPRSPSRPTDCRRPRGSPRTQSGRPSSGCGIAQPGHPRRASPSARSRSSAGTRNRARRGAAARRVTSATVPSATTRPRLRIRTREQVSSTSPRKCVLEHDGRAALARDALDEAQHLPLARRVEPQRRLVEEHDLRVVDQRAGDAEPLAHPAAVGGDPRRPALGQADLVEQRGGRRARRSRGSGRTAARGSAGTPPRSAARGSPRSRAARRSAAGSPPGACAGLPPPRSCRRSGRGSWSAPGSRSSCRRRSGPSRPTTSPARAVKLRSSTRDELAVGLLQAVGLEGHVALVRPSCSLREADQLLTPAAPTLRAQHGPDVVRVVLVLDRRPARAASCPASSGSSRRSRTGPSRVASTLRTLPTSSASPS